jgi:DNA repair exonuclease SbcCD ATPase subunit
VLRPLEQTAAEFRHECAALDQMTETLLGEIEQLRQEVDRRAEELEEGRRRLAERGRQLADQRKETARLAQLMEQQDANLSEALAQLRALREQLDAERNEARLREDTRVIALEHRLSDAESQREELRHQLQILQASSAANTGGSDALAPLLAELGDLRRQFSETQSELAQARLQLTAALERGPASYSPAGAATADGEAVSPESQARLNDLERERLELESELELVRTRATELQETVNSQRRELTEQRAELSSELRALREMVERSPPSAGRIHTEAPEPVRVASIARDQATAEEPPPDPVISSVMAQFARLQKDVAQRRKKK